MMHTSVKLNKNTMTFIIVPMLGSGQHRGSYTRSKARLLGYLGLLECIYEAIMHYIIRFQLDDFTDCDPPKHVVFR